MRSVKEIFASDWITDAEMVEHGFTWEEIPVVRFTDMCTDKRWFYRKFDELGTVRALCGDARHPVRPDEVRSFVRKAFGEYASLIY